MSDTRDQVEHLPGNASLPLADWVLPPTACIHCRAVRVGGRQATYKIMVTREFSRFRCRVCRRSFLLPRRELSV